MVKEVCTTALAAGGTGVELRMLVVTSTLGPVPVPSWGTHEITSQR